MREKETVVVREEEEAVAAGVGAAEVVEAGEVRRWDEEEVVARAIEGRGRKGGERGRGTRGERGERRVARVE